MNKRSIFILGIVALVLIGFSLSTAQKSAVIPKKEATPIPADKIVPITPPVLAGAKDECYLWYTDWLAYWYYPCWRLGDKVAIYFDPEDCDFDSIYPFQLTDVTFVLWDFAEVESVDVRFSVEIVCPEICDGPGIEIYQSPIYTITTFHPDLVTIYFPEEDTICLDKPFFFNLEYMSYYPDSTMPSVLFDTLIVDTCYQWVWVGQPRWIEWYDFWSTVPGWILLEISGLCGEEQTECGEWYWKPDTTEAPSGMPDFDQNQDAWVAYCGPTAVANCLWWFDAVPPGWTPPQLIDTLARYFHTNPSWGTYVDTMQMGLDQYFQDYGFALKETTYWMPDFYEMEDSLKVCQDIILLLGFWWWQGPEQEFIRGDVNEDGIVTGADWILCEIGGPFSCDDAADVNDDGILNMADCDYLYNYIYAAGPPPPPPFPECGLDPTTDHLDCDSFPPCPEGTPGEWGRAGGHFVTMAGVNSEKKEIAISDPDRDQCVQYPWWPGRVRPPEHPGPGYPPTLHNNPTYVSHDVYISLLYPEFPSPSSDKWELADYCYEWGKYFNMNVPERFRAFTKAAPKHLEYYRTEVEAAVMICPKPNNPPEIIQPDSLEGYINDTVSYTFTGTDPDGDAILDSASLVIAPSCGTYSVTRTSGHGTSTGTWQVTWLTNGCEACTTYLVIVDLTDTLGATAYCTTWVHLSSDCDTNDLGICDTIYIETFDCDHEYQAAPGSFDSVRVAIYVTHDSNTFWWDPLGWVQDSIAAMVIPLTFWHQPPGCADSVVLPNWDNWNNTVMHPADPRISRSIFRHIVDEHTGDTVYNRLLQMVEAGKPPWEFIITDIESHSCDGDSGHAFLTLVAGASGEKWWEGSRELLATLTFHVYMSEDCDTTEIGIDSTFWSPLGGSLRFARYDAAEYSPRHFLPVKDTIYMPTECCQFPDTTCAMMPTEYCIDAGGIPTPGVPCSDDGWCKDTSDLGVPDSLYVETFDCDHSYEAMPGSFDSVRVPIYVTHDSNTIQGLGYQDSIILFTIPLTFWHQPEGCADSVILPTFGYWNNFEMNPSSPLMNRSIFRHIVDEHTGDTVYNRLLQMVEAGDSPWVQPWGFDIDSHSCDGDSGHYWLALCYPFHPFDWGHQWWEGSRVLLATLTFHVYMSEDCDTTEIGLDSTFWPVYGQLTFQRRDGVFYCPRHFLPVKDTIYAAPKADVSAGEDQTGATKEDVSVMFYIQNIGAVTDTFDLDITSSLGWDIEPPDSVLTLDPSEIDTVSVTVSIPNVPLGTSDWITLEATPQSNPYAGDSDSLAVTCDYYSIIIDRIADVPNDQGKQVRIEWLSFTDFDSSVTFFTIFRRIDSLLVASGVSVPNLFEVSESFASLDYPPGRWEVVGTIPAFGETLYATIVPTLKDSTISEGMYYTVFFIRAGTDNPYVYYDSPIDSGYSVDNLSPSPPAGLFASHQEAATKLTWSPTSALDFDYYTLYRGDTSGFTPNPSNRLGFTTDTTFVDSTAELGRTYYYLASATDFSGNESDPSNEAVGVRYITGDTNGDGVINSADVVYLINYLFKGGPAPEPLEAGDCNCDGVVNSADVVYLINYLFKGGPPPGCD